MTMHPQIEELVAVCVRQKVSHVILGGGIPNVAWVKTLKDAGIKVMCFAPALVLAKKLLRSGVDALILEGTEAGGHIGPVATNVLVQEILPAVKDVPVFVAGGIGSGEMMAAFLAMGAAGCQLEFQAGVHQSQRPRRRSDRSAGRAFSRHSRSRFGERRHEALYGVPAGND